MNPTGQERRDAVASWLARVPRAAKVLFIILAVLVAVRVAAPFVVVAVANHKLANLKEGYTGHIDDVDLSLIGGKVSVEGIRLDRLKGDPQVPLVTVDRVGVDYQWAPLLRGRFVANVTIDHPVASITPEATGKKNPRDLIEQKKEGKALDETLKALLPATIQNFHLRNGVVRFKDGQPDPDVAVRLSRINVYVANLSNRKQSDDKMPARGRASALVQDSGQLRAQFAFDILAKKPTFDLNLALRGLQIRELNDFIRAYGKADVEKGTASFYTEMEARNGRIQGYFKPLMRDVEVLDSEGGDKEDPWYRKVWEGAIGAVEDLFENKDKDQLATRVPVSGKLDKPGTDVWVTVVGLVSNAFIEALTPGLEHSVGRDKRQASDERRRD